jgi:hypothetical protein
VLSYGKCTAEFDNLQILQSFANSIYSNLLYLQVNELTLKNSLISSVQMNNTFLGVIGTEAASVTMSDVIF